MQLVDGVREGTRKGEGEGGREEGRKERGWGRGGGEKKHGRRQGGKEREKAGGGCTDSACLVYLVCINNLLFSLQPTLFNDSLVTPVYSK